MPAFLLLGDGICLGLGGLGLEEWKAGFWGYWCLYPSLDVTSAESILGSTVSTPAAWEFGLILESGLIHGSPTALSRDSDPASRFSDLDLQAQEKLLFPVCLSDLTFWVFSNHAEAAWEVGNCLTERSRTLQHFILFK